MAFCTKCGKELADGEVCSCQQQAKVVAPQAPVNQEAAEKKTNKMAVPAAIGVVAILLIVLVVSLLGGKPYKKMLDEYVELVNKKSTDVTAYDYVLMAESRVKLAKNVQKAYLKIEETKELQEAEAENKADAYEECDEEYEGWKLSYEIKSAEKMEEKVLKDYQKSAKNYYKDSVKPVIENQEEILENDDDQIEEGAELFDISESEYKALVKATLKQNQALEEMEITEGYEVKVKFYVNTKDDEYKADTVKVAVLKVNGDWVYAGLAKGEDKRFTFDESGLRFLVTPLNKSYIYK
ncbi:MAG: hypothetical protein IKK33_11680 [Lachnospiraceae bacterium]|nr:hypothetical protein [Lachnospiraceae bacterium]